MDSNDGYDSFLEQYLSETASDDDTEEYPDSEISEHHFNRRLAKALHRGDASRADRLFQAWSSRHCKIEDREETGYGDGISEADYCDTTGEEDTAVLQPKACLVTAIMNQ